MSETMQLPLSVSLEERLQSALMSTRSGPAHVDRSRTSSVSAGIEPIRRIYDLATYVRDVRLDVGNRSQIIALRSRDARGSTRRKALLRGISFPWIYAPSRLLSTSSS